MHWFPLIPSQSAASSIGVRPRARGLAPSVFCSFHVSCTHSCYSNFQLFRFHWALGPGDPGPGS